MAKANEIIDKIIGLNDIKIGNDSYFKNNILESLLQKELAPILGKDSPELKDMIEISAGTRFGQDKKWGLEANIGKAMIPSAEKGHTPVDRISEILLSLSRSF